MFEIILKPLKPRTFHEKLEAIGEWKALKTSVGDLMSLNKTLSMQITSSLEVQQADCLALLMEALTGRP
jgi:hypothetical protein